MATRTRKVSAYALRRSIMADRWLARVYQALRAVYRGWWRTLVARYKAGGSAKPSAADVADLEGRLYETMWTLDMAMMEAGYTWAANEFTPPASGRSGPPGVAAKKKAAPDVVPDWDEFLQQADFSKVEEHLRAISKRGAETQAGAVDKAFQTAAAEHESVASIAKALLKNGLVESDMRAALWARTETQWAYNEGAHLQYQAQNVPVEEWVVTLDDATCEFCLSMDGVKVRTADNFVDAGDRVRGTEGGDYKAEFPVGHPPLHPGCRCVIVPGVL